MPTGNTTLLGLALPVEGELDGEWGDVVNDSITALLDSAVAGTTTLSADEDVTLSDTVLAANQARQATILWTASNGATTRNITAPARSKAYIVVNAGTGSIVLRGAGPTTGVTIVAGEKCLAAWNGSDFVKVATSATSSGDVSGPASATNNALVAFDGATGKLIKNASLTANNVLLGNDTGAPQAVAPGPSGNVLTSNGTTWQSSTPAAASGFPTGTVMLFVQTTAPTGWVKSTTHDNKALRVVSGTASSGGTVAFTTAFASKSVSGSVSTTTANTTAGGTVGGSSLTLAQTAPHAHNTQIGNAANGSPGGTSIYSVFASGGGQVSATVGSGTTHTHSFTGTAHNHTATSTFSGTAINLAVQYVDVIIATKD
jgi:hypothetical protein